jgi:uncharacterized protein
MEAANVTLVRDGGGVVCERCRVAGNPIARAWGLLGRRSLAGGEGLLLPRTRAVHTHFMRFPIDVVFVDRDGLVVRLVSELRPWRAASCRRAHAVLELTAGECERRGLREGDRLTSSDLQAAA